jgi:hypothetical protein
MMASERDDGDDRRSGERRVFTPLAGENDPFEEWEPWRTSNGRHCPLTGFATESALASAVLARLEPWFHVRTEVWGQHPLGTSCRIDAVLTPRDTRHWKRQDISLGVEFKDLDSRTTSSRHNLTGWVAQSIDYAYVSWENVGRLPIFMCPSPIASSNFYDNREATVEDFANGLLGHFGIGYLTVYEHVGLALVMQGRHRVWSERHGVEHGRRWLLNPQIGTR